MFNNTLKIIVKSLIVKSDSLYIISLKSSVNGKIYIMFNQMF